MQLYRQQKKIMYKIQKNLVRNSGNSISLIMKTWVLFEINIINYHKYIKQRCKFFKKNWDKMNINSKLYKAKENLNSKDLWVIYRI